MNLKLNKKAMEMSVNLIVTLIIGLVIFGLGMGLFSKISGSGDKQISDLNNQIKNNIASLECDGGEVICSPSYKMKNGDSKTFQLYISNPTDDNGEFKIKIDDNGGTTNMGKPGIYKSECGGVLISYPDVSVNILSQNSAEIPFIVTATRVTKTPCSFVTTANLLDNTPKVIGKTAIIIRVE